MKVIKNHVPPTPKPTSALPPTPPSKTISDTKTNQQAEQFSSKFILVVVEDMWVFCLRDPDTFYSDVTPHQLLAHLTTSGGGTETNNKTVMYMLVTNKKMLTTTNAKLIATNATFLPPAFSPSLLDPPVRATPTIPYSTKAARSGPSVGSARPMSGITCQAMTAKRDLPPTTSMSTMKLPCAKIPKAPVPSPTRDGTPGCSAIDGVG